MQYIILLRGINVGGRTIKMNELKSCFQSNGYQNVQTVLQTGNVIIDSGEKSITKVQSRIAAELTAAFNYPAKILVITPKQLQDILGSYPFKGPDLDFHHYVVFTESGFEKILVKDFGVPDKSMEEVKAGEHVVYWRVLKGNTLESVFGKYLAKVSAKSFATTRNVNTLEKILTKCS